MSKRNKIIWYHPDLKLQACELRNNCTFSEAKLWERLKGKQMKGYDFHRQKPLNYYIIDFYCNELKLAIEIDGEIHESEENLIKDLIRQERLQDYGISFLRFKDSEIKNNIEEVLYKINKWIGDYEITIKTHP
jgi:very-short-patch-repair endonuclease